MNLQDTRHLIASRNQFKNRSAIGPNQRSGSTQDLRQNPLAAFFKGQFGYVFVLLVVFGLSPCSSAFGQEDTKKPITNPLGITNGILPGNSGPSRQGEGIQLSGQGALQPISNEEATKLYEEKLQAWKEVIKEIRETKIAYSISSFDEHEAIARKYADLYFEGERKIQEVKEAALLKFSTDPELDFRLAGFLSNMVERDVKRDDYASAYTIARELLKTEVNSSQLYNYSGIAAFAMYDYDLAEKWLARAQEINEIDQRGLMYYQAIESYRLYWQEELAIRAEEAKANDLPRVKMTTNKGDIVLELFENEAPDTVGNFISLVEDGFYDGLTFHRVMSGFMAQGGSPNGTGTGGPGYMIYCETDRPDHRKHFIGTLSMGRYPKKNTGGSQFFITFAPTPHLNGEHTVFGRVLEGMDVVQNLQRRDPESEDGETIIPDVIEKAVVLRKRDHEYKPNKVTRD